MDASPDRQRTDKRLDVVRIRELIADGLRWQIREMRAPAFDRRGGTHLMFDGEIIMRRVRSFPADWYDLSDEELYAISEHIRNGEER